MKHLPIRLRLTVWYLAVFSLALAAFGVSAWLLVRQKLYSELSSELQARVESVGHFIAAQGQNPSVAHLYEELKEEYDQEDQVEWLQILDENGQWIYRSPAMQSAFPAADLPQTIPAGGRTWNARLPHVHLHVLQQPLTVFQKHYTVETATPTDDVDRTLANLRTILLLLAPGFIGLAGIGSYLMARRALASVDAITVKARSITDRNLHQRLPSLQTNDELQRLADTLNEMLARIDAAFLRVRQFTADASHELRTPVSLMRIEAELALRKNRSEEDYRAALSQILAESVRTSELIDSLLSLARADTGADVLQMQPTQCVRLLQEVAAEWQPMFQKEGLQFTVDLPQQEITVAADPTTLRRLLFTLLDNARKYTPPGGRVSLAARRDQYGLRISVTDSGIGIAPEHVPHIFERFYRADQARTRSAGGVGLGLSLAKWIAEQHRTHVDVESSAHSGSVFSFVLQPITGDTEPVANSESRSRTGEIA